MKTIAVLLLMCLALATFAAAQTAPAAGPTVVAVTSDEQTAINTANAAVTAAQAAEAAPVKALLASPSQTALHAATVTAQNQLKAALDTSAAAHAIDQNQYSYSASGGWLKGQGRGPASAGKVLP